MTILSRTTTTVERRPDAFIRSTVKYTPERQDEVRITEKAGVVMVDTATSTEGVLHLTKKIITPLRIVTITHTDEDHGTRIKDEIVVESTTLWDQLTSGEVVIACKPTKFQNKPRFRVYPADDLYGLEDEGDHGEPDSKTEGPWKLYAPRDEDDCGDCDCALN